VKFYAHLWIIEWFVQALRLRINEIGTILNLFQSKTAISIPYVELAFFTEEASGDPLYTLRIPREKSTFARDPFSITNANNENLRSFWKKMREVKILDKAYYIDEHWPHHRSYNPTQLAFHNYCEILASNDDHVDKIHDSIESIEGLFTPERFATKLFIQRVTNVIRLLQIDPNNTRSHLEQAWQVRSEYSHHGKGWEEQSGANPNEETQETQESVRRAAVKQGHLQNLSRLTLNYLRICLIARFVAGMADKEFIEFVDRQDGWNELKTRLEDVRFLASGDSLRRYDSRTNLFQKHNLRTSGHARD